jgi:hypothetical protein
MVELVSMVLPDMVAAAVVALVVLEVMELLLLVDLVDLEVHILFLEHQ